MKNDKQSYRGILLEHEPMRKHTSWRVGGNADRYYQPMDLDDLQLFMNSISVDEPVYWIGLGSNLLVRDGGIRGTVICTSGVLNQIKPVSENTIYVQAGVACPKVARQAAKMGLVGAEFLSGIPGTMGGALAMNAGAFGGETWNLVQSVQTMDRCGLIHERKPDEFRVGYRTVIGPHGEWFVASNLGLTPGDVAVSQQQIKNLLARRAKSQPTNQPSAGSVFRNPEGDYAARLIEVSGMKGTCVGGACVSDKHANFIINMGTATANDIETLIQQIAEKVEMDYGVRLHREVCIVGEAA